MAERWGKVNGWIDVGIELDGQQEGFLVGIDERMLNTNVYFNIANQKGASSRGIRSRSAGSKHNRAITMVPQFKLNKFWFPNELKHSASMIELMNELTNLSASGIQSRHDDGIDICSQLELMTLIAPSGEDVSASDGDRVDFDESRYYWEEDDTNSSSGSSNSYC